MSLTEVKPGDALAIPAAAYNAFVDAARANQADGNALLQVPQSAFQQTGIILVRNDSGADRDRFDVLGIDEPVFDPADDEDAFKNRVVLAGLIPTAADHAGRFAVLLEPIAAGDIGRACISGVCPAWVNFQAAGDAFADVYDGDATQLKGAGVGAAQVLWKQEGTGPLWAVVRLGPDPAAVRWGAIFDYPPDPEDPTICLSSTPDPGEPPYHG